MLKLDCLVLRRGGELRAPGCDRALDLVEAVLAACQRLEDQAIRQQIVAHLHNAISK